MVLVQYIQLRTTSFMSNRTRKVATSLPERSISGPSAGNPEEALKEAAEILFAQEHRFAVLTEDGEVMPCDLFTWTYWLERNGGQRIIQQEDLPGGYWISTVFLGLNHEYGKGKPLWFETMIFQPSDGKPNAITGRVHKLGNEVFCDRYTTLAQALAGHEFAKTAWLDKRNATRGSDAPGG
jgi:hypothetical protein